MARLDLFQLAEANETEYAQRLEAKRTAMPDDEAPRLEAFCRVVHDRGAVSINMKPWKLSKFLDRGQYLSVQEAAQEEARASGRSADDILRERQGAYYARRMAFEGYFVEGERFLYGALNIGGAGASYYGVFCMVLEDQTTRSNPNAYLPEDSLQQYVPEASPPHVDEPGLRRDLAPLSQRHALAGIKHAEDIPRTAEPAWPALLCEKRYVESIFVAEVSPSNIEEFRIEKSAMTRLSDMAFEDLMGTLASEQKAEVASFSDILKRLDELGLTSRLVEV